MLAGALVGFIRRADRMDAKRLSYLVSWPRQFGLSTPVPRLNGFGIALQEVDLCRIPATIPHDFVIKLD